MKNHIFFTSKWCNTTKPSLPKCWSTIFRRCNGSLTDWAFFENPIKTKELMDNMQLREGTTNLQKIQHLMQEIKNENTENKNSLHKALQWEIAQIPNFTHPNIRNFGTMPKEIAKYGEKPNFQFEPKSFGTIAKRLNQCRTEHLGNFSGVKSYYLMKDLADLEQALIQYTVDKLLEHNFKLISVPDFLPKETIEGCGMNVDSDRTQVYKVHPTSLCLSGTSEMSLAAYFSQKILNSAELPQKVMAVSRCFRAETSGLHDEKGIYRVHNFTKVEMFSVCKPHQSDDILNEFQRIEIDLFECLGLHFRLLDMPPCELGTPAYRKYDIEAWIPSKSDYGEISSCSNCTDFQAKRLNIQFTADENNPQFAHTVNGTACAIPRMIIAIIENYQNSDGTVNIPECLKRYMNVEQIRRAKALPELKLVKHIYENC